MDEADWVLGLKRRSRRTQFVTTLLAALLVLRALLFALRTDVANAVPITLLTVIALGWLGIFAWGRWQASPRASSQVYADKGGAGQFVAAGVVLVREPSSAISLEGCLIAKEGAELVVRNRFDLTSIAVFSLPQSRAQSALLSRFSGYAMRVCDDSKCLDFIIGGQHRERLQELFPSD